MAFNIDYVTKEPARAEIDALVFLKNGKELTRLVRPQVAAEIGAAMRQI